MFVLRETLYFSRTRRHFEDSATLSVIFRGSKYKPRFIASHAIMTMLTKLSYLALLVCYLIIFDKHLCIPCTTLPYIEKTSIPTNFSWAKFRYFSLKVLYIPRKISSFMFGYIHTKAARRKEKTCDKFSFVVLLISFQRAVR